MEQKNRYYLLDALRGLAVISMVAYHAMYDLVAIYSLDAPWFFGAKGYIWQQTICWSFILISGSSWGMSRNPLKKGLLVSACGLIITLATYMAMPSQLIIMGVLSFIGAAAIIMIPIARIAKAHHGCWLGASAMLFFITRNINSGWLGFEGIGIIKLPQFVYDIPLGFILGFVPKGFFSGDYFSLMPWIFLFASGHFAWRILSRKRAFEKIMQIRIPVFSKLGQKSLLIYMLHQPVIMAVITLLMNR